MIFYFLAIILFAAQVAGAKTADIADIVKAALEKLPSMADYSDEDYKHEFQKFYKHLENAEVDSYKETFRAELKERDKKEEQYFADILKKLKDLGRSGFTLGDAILTDKESKKADKLKKDEEEVRKKLKKEQTLKEAEESAIFGVK